MDYNWQTILASMTQEERDMIRRLSELAKRKKMLRDLWNAADENEDNERLSVQLEQTKKEFDQARREFYRFRCMNHHDQEIHLD